MTVRKIGTILLCLVAIVAFALPAAADDDVERDLGHETLLANDGWAALGAGTTGGSLAAPDHIYAVTNRRELIAALNDGEYPPPSTKPSAAPKIIYISGTIDANVDDENRPLTCNDYAAGTGFSLDAYLAAFAPEVWGKKAPSGPMEAARLAAQQKQDARVRTRIGSNTTIIGLGKDAQVRGAWFLVGGSSSAPVSNVMIRNLTFQDTYDCFPAWDPTDGSEGNWNSQYDLVSVRYADHVWIDHNTFQDVATADNGQDIFFGRPYEVHDGALDITHNSDLVTASWNRFLNHDKTMLIGSSDSGSTAEKDRGKLRVTLHHNLLQGTGQRVPRVRFGQVHVYNNYYRVVPGVFQYALGVGIESKIYVENNYFESAGVDPSQFIRVYKGQAMHVSGTYIDGTSRHHQVDLLAAFNAANEPDLLPDAGWVPALHLDVQPTQALPGLIPARAGPFMW